MDGLECTEILFSQLNAETRIDAEYFYKKNLEMQRTIENIPHVNVGNIVITGMQAAEQTLQLVQVVDAVFFGIHQADAVADVEGQLLVVLDADHIALSLLSSLIDGVDELLGLAGALQAHNNLNHRKFLLCCAAVCCINILTDNRRFFNT